MPNKVRCVSGHSASFLAALLDPAGRLAIERGGGDPDRRSKQSRPQSKRWRTTVMRISITAVCVAVLATSSLFSGKANGASEERQIADRLARARNRIDDVMLKESDAKELIKRSRVYIARA